MAPPSTRTRSRSSVDRPASKARRSAKGRSAATAGRGRDSRRAATGGRGAAAPIRSRGEQDRFAGRRQEIRRRQGARRLRIVLGLTAVSLAAVSAIGLLNSTWFDVDELTVVGNTRESTDRVLAASGLTLREPLLDVDLDAARAGVEALPWVREAELDRRLDGEIVIVVEERQPVTAIAAPGGFALVDQFGYQLDVVTSRPEGFLAVEGLRASGEPGDLAPDETVLVLNVQKALPPALHQHVTQLSVEGEDVFLDLRVGGRANLGDSSNMGEKIQALETVLARVDLQCVSTIDLRVPSAAAVRRNDAATGVCE